MFGWNLPAAVALIGVPTVLYGAAEADLTEEIIRVYDQENGAKNKK